MRFGKVLLVALLSASCSLIASVPEPTREDADVGADGDVGADADGDADADADGEAGGMVLTGGISTVSEAIAEGGTIQLTEMGFEWGERACASGPSGEVCVWGGIAP